jgi:hypothetical protein
LVTLIDGNSFGQKTAHLLYVSRKYMLNQVHHLASYL